MIFTIGRSWAGACWCDTNPGRLCASSGRLISIAFSNPFIIGMSAAIKRGAARKERICRVVCIADKFVPAITRSLVIVQVIAESGLIRIWGACRAEPCSRYSQASIGGPNKPRPRRLDASGQPVCELRLPRR